MPLLRRRRPVARLATTAVVAGTAAHMGSKYGQNKEAAAQAQAQPVYAEPAPQAGPSSDDQLVEIQKLASLKDQGILTEAEFTAKKAQILGI